MATRSDQSLLAELDTLEFRLKRTKNEAGLRRILVQFNNIRNESRTKSRLVRARYFFLRGVLYAKFGRNHQSTYLGSSGEVLMYALEQFIEADQDIKAEAAENGWTDELRTLQRRAAYEGMAVVTVLKNWGRNLASLTWPDTSMLEPATQRVIKRALDGNYPLSSRF